MAWYQVRKIREHVRKEPEKDELKAAIISCPEYGCQLNQSGKECLACEMCKYVIVK
jgi:hypothetical protein